MGKLTLVLGGARSGKSSFAQGLLMEAKNVAYIATAEIQDEEMADRIGLHRASRPESWLTFESPLNVDSAVEEAASKVSAILIDCMTLYISNMMLREEMTQADILERIKRLCEACRSVDAEVVIVANEVGQGIVPEYKIAREFRDVAGWSNQLIAKYADEVYSVIAGCPLKLKGEGALSCCPPRTEDDQ